MIDSIEFKSPVSMARRLLRRHNDLSTVRAMVLNEFGEAPSLDTLKVMKAKIEPIRGRASWQPKAGERIAYSLEEYHADMERGSTQLYQAIMWARAESLAKML